MKKNNKNNLIELCNNIKNKEEYTDESYLKIEEELNDYISNNNIHEKSKIYKIKSKLKEWKVSGPETDVKTIIKETIEALIMSL